MKLRSTVKIRLDDSTVQEVTGEELEFSYNKKNTFMLLLHESIQPWTPNVLDISEKTTGCRLTSTDKPVSSSTKADIQTAVELFISDKGLTNVLNKIKERKREKDLTKQN